MCRWDITGSYIIMKKIGLLLVLFCLSMLAMAQDVIVKKDGTTILSKVLEISGTEIKYKKWSNQDGPMYSIDKSEVHLINYQNGEVELMSNSSITKTLLPENERMFRKGKYLTVNGQSLSNEEILSLVGEQNYVTYLSARRQSEKGAGFLLSSILSGGFSIACIVGGVKSGNRSAVVIGAIAGAYFPIGLTLGCVFKGIGNGRISRVADEYNSGSRAFSYQISPSIMRYNSMEKQGNAFGLTLSVKF